MILVVEDHADTLNLLLRLLKRAGYEASGAGCGETALRALESVKPGLIILDCHMPGIDGFGVLRSLRNDARFKDVPVIMFSAANEDAEARARELGAKDFVRKASLDAERLLAIVEKHLATPPCSASAGDSRQ